MDAWRETVFLVAYFVWCIASTTFWAWGDGHEYGE
jgi:hypothetical protein